MEMNEESWELIKAHAAKPYAKPMFVKLVQAHQAQREKLAAYEADMKAARGELGVSLEESPIGSLVSKLVMANRVLRSERSNLQAALAEVTKWTYCPECGCEAYRPCIGDERECTQCQQSWFPDVNYHNAVKQNLKNRYDFKQQLADVTKERDALKACQCDGCNESLEGDAYCLQCYERQRQRVDGLDERLGQLMADKDNQSRTIADMRQQLQQAQATIQRLEGERDDARWFNDNYLKAINKMGNKELELRDRLATVEAALKESIACHIEGRRPNLVDMQQALAPAPGGQSVDANKMVCVWTHDGGDGWETTCRESFNINEGMTPSECDIKFCCFCGKPLEELLASDVEPDTGAQPGGEG